MLRQTLEFKRRKCGKTSLGNLNTRQGSIHKCKQKPLGYLAVGLATAQGSQKQERSVVRTGDHARTGMARCSRGLTRRRRRNQFCNGHLGRCSISVLKMSHLLSELRNILTSIWEREMKNFQLMRQSLLSFTLARKGKSE